MAAPGVAQAPGGLDGPARSEEVQEYEKILKISDEIFSGTHHRLKVPQQFVSKNASRNPSSLSNTQTSTPSSAVVQNSTSNGSAASRNRTVPKTTSEIDPIFLTKSDDLVRAELQLQRQRVEKVLREQLEHKRQEARQKAAVQDAKPDFDVSDVLNQALELVKPASVKSSDSSDENSFYSSRAPDSPPPNGDPQRSSPAPLSQTGNLATEAAVVESSSDELQRLEALNRTGLDREMQDTYPVADQRVPYRYRQQQQAHHDGPVDDLTTADRYYDVPQPDDALDEPDYSPPAPGVPPMERVDEPEYQPELEITGSGGGDMRPVGEGQPSPRGDVRIVRNHITSPAAPQPSRVSPLAVAKVPSVSQMRSKYGTEQQQQQQQHRVSSGQDMERASPDPPAAHHQRPLPRKRRRLQEDKGRPRQISYNRKPGGGGGGVDASEPYIKEEPVSPPPFADAPQPLPPTQPPPALQGRPGGQPVYIDIASPRYTPVMERREPVYEPADPYHEVPSRAASRLSSTRRTVRDDQDLRRVASLQHARQPEYAAREYVEQPSPRAIRAPSYAMVERPTHERATRYYDEPPPPAAAPVHTYSRRYVPIDEPPPPAASPRYREAYYEEEAVAPPPPPPATRMMAPPPRRIVVDEHGNQYYEAPAPPPVHYVSPSNRMTREVYDEVPIRHASVREASVFEDPYGNSGSGGRRYVQEMPPPPPSGYRRVNSDYAPAGAAPPPPPPHPNERRAYATPLGEREPYPRSSSVQIGSEYAAGPPRRATYVEDPSLPRERMVRMPSVRPAATRYEEAGPATAAGQPEVISRVASVRPGSVYMDEERPSRAEYIERPMYVSRAPPPPQEAYYEGEAQPPRMMQRTARY